MYLSSYFKLNLDFDTSDSTLGHIEIYTNFLEYYNTDFPIVNRS